MDDIKQMEILTKLETMQNRLFDNIKEIKDDVKEMKQIVPQINTRLAIIEDKKLEERVTKLEDFMVANADVKSQVSQVRDMMLKALGALVVIQILVTTGITLAVKMLFN